MSHFEVVSVETSIPAPFQFQDKPIRTQLEGDTLWFAARDVCEALNIDWSGKTLASIPQEWKGMGKFPIGQGFQQLKIINEPAVYKLAFRSNKPEADAFTNWVASEVVPAIRKTGKYEAIPTPALPSPLSRRSDPCRKALTKILSVWVGMTPMSYSQARVQINSHFGVTTVDELTVAQVEEAIAWVQAKIDEHLLEKQDKMPSRISPYQNGVFTIPSTCSEREPGPIETKLAEVLKEWSRQEWFYRDTFCDMLDNLTNPARESLYTLIADSSVQSPPVAFIPDSLVEGFFFSQETAKQHMNAALKAGQTFLRAVHLLAKIQNR